MALVGDVVQAIGVWMVVGGYGLWAATLVFRLVIGIWLRRWILEAVVIGFYARAFATVGIVTLLMGSVLKGSASWLMLILVLVIGAPSLALLIVRPVRADRASFGFGPTEKP